VQPVRQPAATIASVRKTRILMLNPLVLAKHW
jgi:hypothetical protein